MGKGISPALGSFGEAYAPTRNITLADLNTDGFIDILITNRGRANEICLNDGNGNFLKTINFGSTNDSTIDVEVADMDNDGDPDLILANRDEQPNYVYLNDGALGFHEKIAFGTGKDNTRSVGVGDLNNDGWADIVTANIGEPNVIYFGNSTNPFTESVIFDSYRC